MKIYDVENPNITNARKIEIPPLNIAELIEVRAPTDG